MQPHSPPVPPIWAPSKLRLPLVSSFLCSALPEPKSFRSRISMPLLNCESTSLTTGLRTGNSQGFTEPTSTTLHHIDGLYIVSSITTVLHVSRASLRKLQQSSVAFLHRIPSEAPHIIGEKANNHDSNRTVRWKSRRDRRMMGDKQAEMQGGR